MPYYSRKSYTRRVHPLYFHLFAFSSIVVIGLFHLYFNYFVLLFLYHFILLAVFERCFNFVIAFLMILQSFYLSYLKIVFSLSACRSLDEFRCVFEKKMHILTFFYFSAHNRPSPFKAFAIPPITGSMFRYILFLCI